MIGRRIVIYVSLLLMPRFVYAQTAELYTRTLYQISHGIDLWNATAYTFSLEPEISFTEGEFSQVDVLGGLTTSVGDFQLAASVVYRSLLGGTNGHEWRPWQQISHAKKIGKYRLRNRCRVEERFQKQAESTSYRQTVRLRYRISTDFPLQGERLDKGEFYLNASWEWLLGDLGKSTKGVYQWRIYSGVGYQILEKLAIEPGLDFRRKPDSMDHEILLRMTIKHRI